MNLYSSEFLRHIRNNIDISLLIKKHLDLPSKHREGFFRFLCPICGEFNTATNPKTNLARCFSCRKNFNTIDLVMLTQNRSFKSSILYLQTLIYSTR